MFNINAHIFVQFKERLKKTIKFSSEGYIIPLKVFYGFSDDNSIDNDLTWYNIHGKPGSEISNNLYKHSIKNSPPAFIYEGFTATINPYLSYKKILYRIRYCYKFRDSDRYDFNNYIDGKDVYYCPAPTRDFWEAVTFSNEKFNRKKTGIEKK